MSLSTRVEIACAVHNLGHFDTWSKIYSSFRLEIPLSLAKLYRLRDRSYLRIRVRQQTKGYKMQRKKKDHDNFSSERQRQKTDMRAGLTYESGIALAGAKRRVKEKDKHRNPPGTKKEDLRCPYYHPLFCDVKGHTSMASAACKMKGKSKNEVKSAKAIIAGDMLKNQLLEDSEKSSKYNRKGFLFSYDYL